MKIHDRNIWDKQMIGKEPIGIENCPFCIDEKKLTIWKGNFWKIIHNKFPYAGLEKHLLLVPYRHVEQTKDLNNDELLEIKEAEKFLSDYYNNEDYFSFIRQTNTGKSIKHLHYHYIPGKLYSCELEKILKNNSK